MSGLLLLYTIACTYVRVNRKVHTCESKMYVYEKEADSIEAWTANNAMGSKRSRSQQDYERVPLDYVRIFVSFRFILRTGQEPNDNDPSLAFSLSSCSAPRLLIMFGAANLFSFF